MSTSTSTSPSTPPCIPIIDISPYLNGSNKTAVAAQIGRACEEIGFFMICGCQSIVSIDLLQKLQLHSTAFFDLPLEEKELLTAPFGLGYMGQGTENVAATLKHDAKVQDYKESLNLTLPVRNGVWPDKPAALAELCELYYQQMELLAGQLMRLFALALNLNEDFFDDKVDQPYTTLRLLNYPEFDTTTTTTTEIDNDIATRNAAHTDYGTLTILWSPDSRGLQARSRQGEWIDVVAPKITEDGGVVFIINIGDLMMNWTNDKWISTLHRVVPHSETRGRRRSSMPFFHNPNPTAIIECIPSCLSSKDEAPKYAPILAKSHLELKVSKALGKTETMGDELVLEK